MKKAKRRGSIIFQVSIMFVVCILLTGGIIFASQLYRSSKDITEQMYTLSGSLSDEVKHAIREYPAHEWLLNYWFEHAYELDVEYDAGFKSGTETEKKCRLLESRCPDLQLKYADEAVIESLSEEDQKLYADNIFLADHKSGSDERLIQCKIPLLRTAE